MRNSEQLLKGGKRRIVVPIKRDTKLGKYIIRDRVGEGGMGVVYRARDGVLGREVAIKTILADKATDRDFLSRFRREAFAISRIEHPHIVKLLDFVEADPANDQPAFMVMEFLPGHDLGWVISKKGPLAIPRAVDRILEACAAVGACHRLGYVHRDLKPNNIFFAEYDQIETTKVLDFGAAKAESTREGEGGDELSELTKKGTYIGTPFYMPPELIARGQVTPAADQYGLAVVLYQALAGVRPFDYDKKKEFKEVELLQSIVKGQYKPLREHRSDLPEGLAAVIKKAMEVQPSNRYLDLHAFGAALRLWASPQISHIWEKHFTSSAPAKIDPKMSVAMVASHDAAIGDGTDVDSTVPPLERLHTTNPTVQAGRDPMLTVPLGTKELRLAGASVATTAVQNHDNPPSISIEFHDPAAAPAAEPSNTPLNTPTQRPPGALLRRPRVILAAAAAATGVVLAVSILLSRATPTPLKPPTPAPELFARPTAAPSPASPPPPVAPTVAPIPATSTAEAPDPRVAAAAAAPENLPKPERKRPVHRHHKPQIVDKNGLAIPSD
jgi:eukaryotic-like serine/threonine-protein kinase